MSGRPARNVPPHWLRGNAASRWPHRWIVFDTEAQKTGGSLHEEHMFRLGVAAWWRDDTLSHREPEYATFDSPAALWGWIDSHAAPKGRTACYAHNLGYDVQLSNAFAHLPALGWELGFANLENGAALVQWRKGDSSLLLIDSMTIFPVGLERVAAALGMAKEALPADDAGWEEWRARCHRDVEILVTAVREFNAWAQEFDIGNWRPTGSGLAWSLWRHRFLSDKILARSGSEHQEAERMGMGTGRAECWRWGPVPTGGLYDWDMRAAYCAVASQVAVPTRFRMAVPSLTLAQYERWREHFAILARVHVKTALPLVPLAEDSGVRWPVGEFETVLWDPEIDLLTRSGAQIRLLESRSYHRAPALRSWACWTLQELAEATRTVPETVALWVKGQSRSLIGRFGMRYHGWEPYSSPAVRLDTGLTYEGGRGLPNVTVLHAGGQAWRETAPAESDDALPSITGYVMSACRARLWEVLEAAGERHIWHVDTDGVLVDKRGSQRLRGAAEEHPEWGLTLKGSYVSGEVRGTRNMTLQERESVAGLPRGARRIGPQTWAAEQWQTLRQGLGTGKADRVLVRTVEYNLRAPDSRREHLPDGMTRPYTPGEFDELHPKHAGHWHLH